LRLIFVHKKPADMNDKSKNVVDDIWLNTLADEDDDPRYGSDPPDDWDEIEDANITINPDASTLDRG
jgi:hypothetical protein